MPVLNTLGQILCLMCTKYPFHFFNAIMASSSMRSSRPKSGAARTLPAHHTLTEHTSLIEKIGRARLRRRTGAPGQRGLDAPQTAGVIA